MRKALWVLFAAVVPAGMTAAEMATMTFTSGTGGTYPNSVKCERGSITVDLSALGKDAEVARAILEPAGDIAGQLQWAGYKAPPPVAVTAAGGDKPLSLLPPRYIGFDATAAVTEAVKAGAGKVVFTIVSLPGYRGDAAVLEVAATGKAKAKIGKVTDLHVHHKAGQTFLTFTEPTPTVPAGEITAKELDTLKKRLTSESPRTTFRVYKHTEPITAATIGKAQFVDEVGQLTCWNREHTGHYPKDDWKVVRFAVEDGKPVAANTGICVLNPAKAGKAYYAVTVAIDGEEDLATFDAGNATTEPVEETVGLGEPVLQKVRKLAPKEHHFYAREATLYYYTRWEAPPNGSRSDNPIDYLVGIPPNLANPAPVDLHLHGWGGSMFGGGFWTNHANGWLIVSTNQIPYDWWTGYHECIGTWRSWADGTVHDYTQTRLLSFLDWVDTKWKVDFKRISVEGGSMGGSGTTNLAVHRADRIAYAAGTVGVHIPAQSPQFTSSYIGSYGPVEWKLPFQDGKTPAFDYFSNVWFLKSHMAKSMPLIVFSNGKNDGQIGWPQALEFFRTLQEVRQPHVFFWGLSGHGQGLSLPGEPAKDHGFSMDLRSDRTLPAFTHCSLDDNPGTATRRPKEDVEKDKAAAEAEKKEKKLQWARPVEPYDGDSIGQANAYLYWLTEDASIIDEPGRWGLTLALVTKSPQDECTVDVTPRRCQKFAPKAGERFKWTNVQDAALTDGSPPKPVQAGEATADENGLVTLKGVKVSKGKNRILIATTSGL